MTTFIITEKHENVLLPLPMLVRRLASLPVVLWGFREITLSYNQPFGLSVAIFEQLTRDLNSGFIVHDRDFRNFIKSDFQIIDGYIDGYILPYIDVPSFTIECLDSTQWEIKTSSCDIGKAIKQDGFKENSEK